MGDRSKFCCLCGSPRRPTQAPLASFGNAERIVAMVDHRPMLEGRWEISPQMIVNVSMYRNGGSNHDTHICDGCILVGLQVAKRFVDGAIAGLLPDGAKSPAGSSVGPPSNQGEESDHG